MEKVLSFSNEQKSLIWKRFVEPEGGTQDEAKHFVEVCETFGLNPLLGDIVFQKYETRQGPRVNFITTRDGLLRVAAQSPDYVGAPVANVVREGDDFEFIPSEGTVKHKFGKKRGKILGAYAILKHRRFHPVAVFVDFDEYYKANAYSQGGKSPIWDKMPSAMIQKIAEVFVLRRQFPLGGLYTQEEMGMDDLEHGNGGNIQVTQTPQTVPSQQEEKQGEIETEQDNIQESNSSEQENQQVEPEKEERHGEESQISSGGQYVLVDYEAGISPSGIPFAKVKVQKQDSSETMLVLAKGDEGVRLAEAIPKNQPFDMEIREENGFHFLESVSVNGQTIEPGAA